MDWLSLLIGLVAGVLIGAVAAWILGRAQARDMLGIVKQQIDQKDEERAALQNQFVELRQTHEAEQRARTRAETELQKSEQHLAELRRFVEDSKTEIGNAFASLSRDALRENRAEFATQAKQEIETIVVGAKGDLEQRRLAIEALVKPVGDELKRYQELTRLLERDRQTAYAGLLQQVSTLSDTTKSLIQETGNLGQALRAPKARGRWGEFTLRRAVEICGMIDRCDFREQVSTEDAAGRPDMIINLPENRCVIVDSKVPYQAYLDATEATSETDRTAHLKRYAAHVRDHVKELADRVYPQKFPSSADFVVMFIPNEAFFSAAVGVDSTLIEEAAQKNVLIASPTMLFALLRIVATIWRQKQIAENAARIGEAGREVYDRIGVFAEHFKGVGTALGRAADAYEAAGKSLQSRVYPATRRIRELGATAQGELPTMPHIERRQGILSADDVPGESADG